MTTSKIDFRSHLMATSKSVDRDRIWWDFTTAFDFASIASRLGLTLISISYRAEARAGNWNLGLEADGIFRQHMRMNLSGRMRIPSHGPAASNSIVKARPIRMNWMQPSALPTDETRSSYFTKSHRVG
eukprot:CAMPEP_0204449586 /NCGR_PEP_ID=MMETSP0470-20130426/99915_1 /ASSEMBLY_ACC=CAM_ASM_000385 /TAXON_ID=2969 /ORGANISM="Oxyrrhis marina" /LENGTH=127 /DNA_ID=CAMNT_0051449409 /DNA_START=1339 /DNA_END=1722 /DNA_ORIENTATION=-